MITRCISIFFTILDEKILNLVDAWISPAGLMKWILISNCQKVWTSNHKLNFPTILSSKFKQHKFQWQWVLNSNRRSLNKEYFLVLLWAGPKGGYRPTTSEGSMRFSSAFSPLINPGEMINQRSRGHILKQTLMIRLSDTSISSVPSPGACRGRVYAACFTIIYGCKWIFKEVLLSDTKFSWDCG